MEIPPGYRLMRDGEVTTTMDFCTTHSDGYDDILDWEQVEGIRERRVSVGGFEPRSDYWCIRKCDVCEPVAEKEWLNPWD